MLKVCTCIRSNETARVVSSSTSAFQLFPVKVECLCKDRCEFKDGAGPGRYPLCGQARLLTLEDFNKIQMGKDIYYESSG